jgi:hypothetical protein
MCERFASRPSAALLFFLKTKDKIKYPHKVKQEEKGKAEQTVTEFINSSAKVITTNIHTC